LDYLAQKVREISSLTNAEYVRIKATLYAIDHEEFKCGDCLSKYADRSDHESQTERMRKLKGCQEFKPTPIHSISTLDMRERIHFRKCIGNYFDFEVLTLIEMQRQYEKGVLPYSGGMADQPNKIIEAFIAIEAYRFDKAERDRKKRESELKRRGR
jgi:hypothetical protein